MYISFARSLDFTQGINTYKDGDSPMVVVRWPVIVWAWYHIAKVVVWVHHHNQPQLRRFFFFSIHICLVQSLWL